METEHTERLKQMFEAWAKAPASGIYPLPRSGSYRQYYRISNLSHTCIGMYNADHRENLAFTSFTRHFKKHGLPVPDLFAEDHANCLFLLQDLGDTQLYSLLPENESGFDSKLVNIYKNVIHELVRFQVVAGKDMDYRNAYPRASFDRQAMLWDLNYFKYYFARPSGIAFDEQKLEDDFTVFTGHLLKVACDFFVYRDFQSRNIMINGGKLFFIDYQGGRKGALQYDLASLIYQAKAHIPGHIRNELLNCYLDEVSEYISINRAEFIKYFPAWVLMRIVQTLGAYGFRGYLEKKQHFIDSIPSAVSNLKTIISDGTGVDIPEMMKVLEGITAKFPQKEAKANYDLMVSIRSFSYRQGIPEDEYGNGGGYVFDCRAVHNPGRYDEYRELTGKDQKVISFFESRSDISLFLASIYEIVDYAVEKYINMKFVYLMVSFGCTGGQHRSVYCAEKLADHLRNRFNIRIELEHTAIASK